MPITRENQYVERFMHSANDQNPIRDPGSKYDAPRQVIEDRSLSSDEKLRILESWRADTIELLRAEEENMEAVSNELDGDARRLTELSKAIEEVSAGKA